MNSFLDRQTICNKEVEKNIYSKPMHIPEKKKFAEFVSTYLYRSIEYNESMNEWFLKIKPDFDKDIVLERTKNYAFDYSEHVKSRKKLLKVRKKTNCQTVSIDLPEIPIYEELGGRMIF